MRANKVKILAAAGVLLAAAVAVAPAGPEKEPLVQYITGNISAEVVEAMSEEDLKNYELAQVELPETRYLIGGAAAGEDGYQLKIQVDGLNVLGGRLALAFDTEKLALNGTFQLNKAGGVTSVPEVEDMVSAEGGYACLAWYSNGLDATTESKDVATLNFKFQKGFGIKDIDAGTFRLLALEEGDMGPFTSAARLETKGTDSSTIVHSYLTDDKACGVYFDYEGSDNALTDGHKVTFRCKNNMDEDVSGLLEVSGKTYPMDGSTAVRLAAGEYVYRVQCAGYGAQTGRVSVSENQSVELTFVNDSTLISRAAEELEPIYAEGDSAEQVTQPLGLIDSTEQDVDVSWQSSDTNVITNEGAVLQKEEAVPVTLTATLSRGEAEAQTKAFNVIVASKAVDAPADEPDVDPEAPADPVVDETKPADAVTPADETKPTDEAKPADETKPANETKPVDETKPADTTKPADETKPTATTKPADEAKPVEDSKTESKPAAAAKPGSSTGTELKFTDLTNYDWAREAIAKLANEGIIEGTSETTFTPAANIRRGDFVLMLMRMLDMEEAEGAEDFVDVPRSSYYYEAISQARALDIAKGVGDNRFDPEASITRQDMVTLTMRAVELTGYLPKSDAEGSLSQFTDGGKTADYAVDSMETAVALELIQGSDGKLNPTGNATRAETAAFFERILDAHTA